MLSQHGKHALLQHIFGLQHSINIPLAKMPWVGGIYYAKVAQDFLLVLITWNDVLARVRQNTKGEMCL